MSVNKSSCSCGGGQSCIIERRLVGDFVHEDEVFKKNNIALRNNCLKEYTKEQNDAIIKDMAKYSSIKYSCVKK